MHAVNIELRSLSNNTDAGAAQRKQALAAELEDLRQRLHSIADIAEIEHDRKGAR
jgi:hypothetical protein